MTPPPSTIADSGQPFEVERVLAGDDALAVELEAGQRLGVRACGQHDVAADEPRTVDLDGVGRDEPAVPSHVRDLGGA